MQVSVKREDGALRIDISAESMDDLKTLTELTGEVTGVTKFWIHTFTKRPDGNIRRLILEEWSDDPKE